MSTSTLTCQRACVMMHGLGHTHPTRVHAAWKHSISHAMTPMPTVTHPMHGCIRGRCSKPAPRQPVVCPSATPGGADRFFKSADRPVPVLGPVEVINASGHGRGLGLTQTCEKGDLLMVSLPISLVYGSEAHEEDAGQPGIRGGVGASDEAEDEGEEYDLRFEALKGIMGQQRFTATQARWLEVLSKGVVSDKGSPTPDMCIDHTKERGQPLLPLPEPLASQPDALEAFLQTYTFEAESEDQELAARAGREPRHQLLGLWPEHALLNHSCVPSTVSFVHKGALVTRVTRKGIPKASELFTNYLGEAVMAPLDVRREALEDVWGFVCGCPRCKEEERLDKDMQQLITDVYDACSDQVNEDLVSAIEAGDEEDLESLQEQLAAFVELIRAACEKKRLTARTTVYVEASLFCMFEALHHVLEERGSRDLGLTNKLQTLAGAIWPGSETHCYWARVHLDAVAEAVASGQLLPGKVGAEGKAGSILKPAGGKKGVRKGGFGAGRGPGGGAASGTASDITPEAADDAYYRALSTRYGPISRSVYKQILEDEGDEDEDEGKAV